MTNSLSFPNMFDVVRNRVGTLEDNASVVNRSRLLILTDPGSLYNNQEQGVGLRRYLWQYNTPNVRAMVQDRIKEQLRLYEPCCDAEETSFADGLLFTGSEKGPGIDAHNKLEMTVGIQTVYGDTLEVGIDGTN